MSNPGEARFPLGRAALVWAVLCGLLLLTTSSAILGRHFPDPDDTLRLVQVRDLLAGQSWFDVHQYRIDPPRGVAMHWSRIVDIPLAALIGLLTPVVGSSSAEMAALVAIPLVTLGVLLLFVARIASRFFDTETVTLACLSLGLQPLLVAQVQPMRIDHHGWQVVCVIAALTGLLPGRGMRGVIFSGFTLAVGLSISLELLPILAGFGAVFAVRWLYRGDSRSLPVFLAALTLSLVLLFVATRGFLDLTQHCDAISPPHLALFAVTAGLTAAVAWLRPKNLPWLLVLLGLSAVGGLAVFLSLAPTCAAGPFGNLDPLVHHFWYENVREGLPTWDWQLQYAIPVILAGFGALLVLAHLARTRPDVEHQWWTEYLLVAGIAFVAALLVLRSQAFVGALSAVPIGWLAVRMLERFRAASTPARRLLAGIAAVIVLLPSFPVSMAQAIGIGSTASNEPAKTISESGCDLERSLPRLNQLPAQTIFAPLDIGPAIVERTHHSVVATGHHRGAAAMHDVIAAFTAQPEVAQSLIARHHAGYVMLCRDVAEPHVFAKEAPHGLAAELLAGRVPDWLEPVNIGVPQSLKLWRVKA